MLLLRWQKWTELSLGLPDRKVEQGEMFDDQRIRSGYYQCDRSWTMLVRVSRNSIEGVNYCNKRKQYQFTEASMESLSWFVTKWNIQENYIYIYVIYLQIFLTFISLFLLSSCFILSITCWKKFLWPPDIQRTCRQGTSSFKCFIFSCLPTNLFNFWFSVYSTVMTSHFPKYLLIIIITDFIKCGNSHMGKRNTDSIVKFHTENKYKTCSIRKSRWPFKKYRDWHDGQNGCLYEDTDL